VELEESSARNMAKSKSKNVNKGGRLSKYKKRFAEEFCWLVAECQLFDDRGKIAWSKIAKIWGVHNSLIRRWLNSKDGDYYRPELAKQVHKAQAIIKVNMEKIEMAAKKKKVKKTSAKAVKKKAVKSKRIPAKQGDCKVGDKNPPKEHQFKPGQSGNPAGPPVRRTQLWVWFCKYMNMTNGELVKLKTGQMTQAQHTALKLVRNMKRGKESGSERLAKHVFDREEGKAIEHLIIANENTLSDEECEDIREVLLRNHAD